MDSKKSNSPGYQLNSRNTLTPEIQTKIIKKLSLNASLEEKQLYIRYALYKTGYYQRLTSHTE